MVKLPFKFKSKDKSSKFLTIDIGSNDIKVMAFDVEMLEGGSKAAVTGFSRQALLEDATRSGVIIDPDEVERALSVAVSEAVNGGVPITQSIIGVSGGLSVGLMTTVRVIRGKKQPISSKEIENILERVQNEAYNQVQNVFLEMTGDSEIDFQLITSSIVYTKLDGEEVDNLEGKEGQKIELAMFSAFSPAYHLDILQEISSRVGLEIAAIGSTMYALTKSISYSKGRDFDGVIMDIGGEITDVGVIFSGGIASTKSVDIGGTHFTKVLSKGMNLSYTDAEHKKLEYSYGRFPESENIIVKGHFDNLLDVWLDSIELLFQDFTGVKTFAPEVYLVGGGSELPDIYDVISKEPWSKSIPFKSPPEFSRLTLEDFPLITDKTGKAGSLENLVPAALSIIYLEARGLID